MKKENWVPGKFSRICSNHFRPEDYVRGKGLKKWLKADAVPSVFSFEYETNTELTPLPLPCPIDVEMDDSSTSLPNPSTKNKSVQTISCHFVSKKIAALRSKVYRLKKKMSKMDDLVNTLKEKCYGGQELYDIMDNVFAGLPILPLLRSQVINLSKAKRRRRYTQEVKEFALTVYFYSPKAYQFLRKYLFLPHKAMITKWISSIDGEPGLLTNMLEFLKSNQEKPHIQNVALVFDSMAIRKQRIYDKKRGKFVGNTDLGGIADSEKLATEALFFQIVSYASPFKLPVAYFLINSINSDLQAQLLLTIIQKLKEVGVTVRSVTCDGPLSNVQTLKRVGCKLPEEPYFPHPLTGEKVYVFLDPCHMLKLARNALADLRTITSAEGEVKWSYIEALNEVQQQEGLKFGNKLNLCHINFKNKVMNVALAAQTLSSGVADAIDYLRRIGHPEFKDSEATIRFIRVIDRCFDILNSRNPFGKGFKQPIRPSNMDTVTEITKDISGYLLNLSVNGTPILLHRRKTFVTGFLTCINSLLPLVSVLFGHGLKYFLSYKVSQDNLEIFFSCIRSLGGHNNNPNCLQLKWAVQKTQLRSYISPSVNANCRSYDESEMLGVLLASKQTDKTENFYENLPVLIGQPGLSSLTINICTYIAGFIVRKMLSTLTCPHCRRIVSGVEAEESALSDHTYCFLDSRSETSFQRSIDRGGLMYSSSWVNKIVKTAEQIIKGGCRDRAKLVTSVGKENLELDVFHPLVTSFEEDLHETQIVKHVSQTYFDIKMHAMAKQENIARDNGTTIRQKLKKLVLFNNV